MIEARGLHKRFGEVRAVTDVSFQVGRGELVGFLGPNGAGKSTTMKMLTGYLYPDEGEVTIGGHPMDGEGRAARARIGYLPEHTPLYREMRVDRYLRFVAAVRSLNGAAGTRWSVSSRRSTSTVTRRGASAPCPRATANGSAWPRR